MDGVTNPATITADFELYDSPGSQYEEGLFHRRYDEALMYLYGEYTHASPPGTESALISGGCSLSQVV